VNGVWLPDSHRLNFKYVGDARRLKTPMVKGQPVDWRTAIRIAAQVLKAQGSESVAMLVSARMTNEELFLASQLIEVLGIEKQHDVVPRLGEPDGIMIPADRNPNTTGAKLLGLCGSRPGARLKRLAEGVKSGKISALICLGEDATKAGLTDADLARVTIIALDILPNKTTPHATVLLPGCAWVEKRGSMLNIHGRLQRLNRAVAAPGRARDDWEILRDLLLAVAPAGHEASAALAAVNSIEDLFAEMAKGQREFRGQSLSRIGDLGVPVVVPKSAEKK
jgi:NADH-quinone oxidoreductase subunit G